MRIQIFSLCLILLLGCQERSEQKRTVKDNLDDYEVIQKNRSTEEESHRQLDPGEKVTKAYRIIAPSTSIYEKPSLKALKIGKIPRDHIIFQTKDNLETEKQQKWSSKWLKISDFGFSGSYIRRKDVIELEMVNPFYFKKYSYNSQKLTTVEDQEIIDHLIQKIDQMKKKKTWYRGFQKKVYIPKDEYTLIDYSYLFQRINLKHYLFYKTDKTLTKPLKFDTEMGYSLKWRSNYKIEWADRNRQRIKYLYFIQKDVLDERSTNVFNTHNLLVYGENNELISYLKQTDGKVIPKKIRPDIQGYENKHLSFYNFEYKNKKLIAYNEIFVKEAIDENGKIYKEISKQFHKAITRPGKISP